jgi:hypothetical protein
MSTGILVAVLVLGALLLFVGVFLGIVMLTFRFNPFTWLTLRSRGVRTTATVLAASGLNHNPRSAINLYELELELQGAFAGQRVQTRVTGPRTALVPGQTLTVVVDPHDPKTLRVDW